MDAQDASTLQANTLFLSDVNAVLAQESHQQDPSTVNIIASTLREHATEEGQFYAQYNTPRQVTLRSDLAVIQFGLSGIHIAGFERALAHNLALLHCGYAGHSAVPGIFDADPDTHHPE